VSTYSTEYQLIIPYPKERAREVTSSISIPLDSINVEPFQGTVNAGKAIAVIEVNMKDCSYCLHEIFFRCSQAFFMI
jgi:hypothetical protein